MVIADSIQGGPHEWPMDTRTKVNNSEEVWAFFKPFTLSGATALPRRAVPSLHPGLSAEYADGMIRLRGAGENAAVRVLDHRGRLAAAASAREGRFEFRGKPAGVYQVLVGGNGGMVPLEIVVP
jgi:hypothetical protein